MILDKLSNLTQYRNLNQGLDDCIHFIQSTDLTKLPLGKTLISKHAFVSRFDYVLDLETKTVFEGHHNYGDMHFTLAGQEQMGFCELDDCTITQPYNQENDVFLGDACARCCYTVDENHFAIVFKDDIHQVRGYVNPQPIQKIVFKFKL